MRLPARRTRIVLAVALSTLVGLAAPATASSTPPAPIVIGIVLREVGPSFAMIQDPATSRTGLYGVGARVGAAVVKAILADRVILVDGHERTQLRLGTAVSAVPPAPGDGAALRPPKEPGPRDTARTGAPSVGPPASPYGKIAAFTAGADVPTGDTTATGGSARPMAGVGQAGGPADASEGTQNGLSAAISITGRLHDGSSQSGSAFSTTSLRDLLISLSYSNIASTHRQRVELYAPDGSLYQRLSGPVAPSTQTLVPVGGTWITDHSLFGAWRADVYIDRETTAIVSRSFTLAP